MIRPEGISTIYVSQEKGDDRSTGFLKENTLENGPLKTIERALEKVKELRRAGYEQPLTIKILDEKYTVTKPIEIDCPDSYMKTGCLNLTIEPYTKTLISGGMKINNFKRDTFNGQDCFSAEVEQIKDGFWFTDLYVDAQRAAFTRYPQNGTLKPSEVDNNDTSLHAHSKWFKVSREDLEKIKSLKNIDDCFISYNHYWVDEHTPIESFDEESGKIICKYYSRFSVSDKYPQSALNYIIENVAEEFKNPNEWYLDRETSKIYYLPRNGEQTPENIDVYAPVSDRIFIIKGTPKKAVCNVCIRGFEIAYTKGDYVSQAGRTNGISDEEYENRGYASDGQSVCAAPGCIQMEYAKFCRIEDCTLHSIGLHAIRLCNGCKNIRITGNDIFDMGAGGIVCGGADAQSEHSEHNGGNVISSNRIHSLGKRYYAGCGILLMHSYGNTVSHNEISDLYYTGISVGWVWGYDESISNNNIIEYNHIYNIGNGVLSDMGGIYLLGKQQGTIVRNNMIHDVTSKHYGGWCIYTDEGSSYITIENNICYNASSNCYHQHFGCMNTVRNNIFAKAGETLVKYTRHEMHTGLIFERNIFVTDKNAVYAVGAEKYFNAGGVHVISSHENMVYDVSGREAAIVVIDGVAYNIDKVSDVFGLECGSKEENPCFNDYNANDFTLGPDSAAYKIGYKPIDISNIGII